MEGKNEGNEEDEEGQKQEGDKKRNINMQETLLFFETLSQSFK